MPRVSTKIFKYCGPNRVLSSTTRKFFLLSTAFCIYSDSSAPNFCTVFLQVVSSGKLSQNRFLTYLLFSLYKEMSADKNVLVTFSTKSLLLLLKNVLEVWGICCLDLLNAFWCLDVFPWLSTTKLLLQEATQLHNLQYR